MHGVDDHAELVVLVCAVDEDAAQQTELRGRETDAVRVLHDPAHPRDERTQIVGELLDLARALAQRRVGIAPDLPERELASRLGAILALLLAAFLPRGLGGGGHDGDRSYWGSTSITTCAPRAPKRAPLACDETGKHRSGTGRAASS